MIGLVATVMVVVPTFGPLIGGLLDTGFGWEAIFLFTAVTSAMVVAWAALALPETRGLNAPPGAQQGFLARSGASSSRSAKFAGYVCAGAFGSATFFAFLGGGPHVIVTLMERSAGGIRRLVRDLLDRLHGRQLRRLAAVDALRHRHDDLVGHRLRSRWASRCRAVLAVFAHALGPGHRVRAAD